MSGCALVGPAIGLGSMALTGPLQFAGTAYTVCEYGYEYAVNDRTPDEVLNDKLEDMSEFMGLDDDAAMMADSSTPRLTLREKQEMAQDKEWLSSLAFRSDSDTGMEKSRNMHFAMARPENTPYTFADPQRPEGE